MTGKEIKTEMGKLVLSEEAIATIARCGRNRVLWRRRHGRSQDDRRLVGFFGYGESAKGVSVSIDGDEPNIELFVNGYGVKISEVAR